MRKMLASTSQDYGSIPDKRGQQPGGHLAGMIWRLVPAAIFLAVVLLEASGCINASSSRASASSATDTYSSDVMKGAWLYVEYACVRCHGIGGKGGSGLPSSGPSLVSNEFKRTFPKTPAADSTLVSVIRNGLIIENDRAASMPAWNGILSEEEMGNIVAYIRAGLPDVGVPLPPARTGEEIYKAFACVKCHGAPGTGGIPNVAAKDPAHQVIPPLGGAEFRNKLKSKDEVRKHLLNGTFVEEGRVGVLYGPAWGRIGTAEQMEKVIEYIWNYDGTALR